MLGFLVAGLVSGWQRVSTFDWELRPSWLVLGIALLLVFYLATGAGYVAIVELLTDARPRRHHSLSVWARSLLGRYVPGNVLMVIGRVALGKDAGIPGRVSLAASVYEQAFGLGAAAIGSLLFLAFGSELGQGKAIWLVALIPLGLILLHPRIFRRVSSWALRKARREPLTRYLRRAGHGPAARLVRRDHRAPGARGVGAGPLRGGRPGRRPGATSASASSCRSRCRWWPSSSPPASACATACSPWSSRSTSRAASR